MAPPLPVQKKTAIQWSHIEPTPVNQEKLRLLTHSSKILAKNGYVLKQPSEQEIWKKMRCQSCGQKIKRCSSTVPHEHSNLKEDLIDFDDYGKKDTDIFGGSTAEEKYALEVAKAASSTLNRRQTCLFHDGQTFRGIWQCCGGRANTKGCCSNKEHVAGDISELRAEWSFQKTPAPVRAPAQQVLIPGLLPVGPGKAKGGRVRGRYRNVHSPRPSPLKQPDSGLESIRPFVALDCEMGTSRLNNLVLIRVSLIDFFTQEPLIDTLVSPTVEMAHYNTRYSGVTFSAMRIAIRTNTAIRGTDAARKEVFKYVNSNTIVVVHGGSGDFTALRWIHPPSRIIDTCILETYDAKVKQMGWRRGLKEVCERRCGIKVQDAKLDNGRMAGHDSLEDAFAAREIVCAWLRIIPDA